MTLLLPAVILGASYAIFRHWQVLDIAAIITRAKCQFSAYEQMRRFLSAYVRDKEQVIRQIWMRRRCLPL